ncbi:PAS domain S-box protein [Metabacillus litoralis]|jgi:two-component system, sporulation sensor kinase A|uniref:PAS domain S-box protein n=1 Tax=Metabacillus litoralis TaxID=152268 RepID=UPI00203E37DF|nr:PAS domain S-box protein [Metabacillus litoralis]MCM3652415.1 PAS domain S-box protein [Metabacillus litoralis]
MDRTTTNGNQIVQNVQIYAVVSSNGRFQYVSSNSIELMGYANSELIGKYIKEFIHSEDLFLIESYFYNEHHLHPSTFRFLNGMGRYIWFEATVEFIQSTVMKKDKEIVLKMSTLNTNSALNEQSSERHDESVENYEIGYIDGDLMLEDVPSPLYISVCGKIRHVNKMFQDLLGASSKDQLIGRQIVDFIDESFHGVVKNRIHRMQNGERVGIIEQTWKRIDGTSIHVEVTSNPTILKGQKAEVIALTDISSRRNFQKILQASRERYQRLIDNSIDTIAVIHQDKWVFVNDSGVKLFDALDYAEMLGKNIFDNLHPNDHQQVRESFESILYGATDVQITHQSWNVSKNKTIYTEMVCIPTTYFGERAVQVILRDISDRKKTEELMLRSEKLSVAGQLAAGIAHEIRNPLTAIKGFLQIMSPDLENFHQYFQIIFSELNRIELILSELLMLAKPQEANIKKINLVSLLQDVSLLLETQANLNGVFFEQKHEDLNLFIHCDQNQLKQVFINLLKNAIDAMPKGGKVLVHTKREDNSARIIVKDEGVGIPIELLDRIGEPFFTTKETGNGLGLMITYKIIEEHNGTILVESKQGEGSMFTVEIPCS